MNNLLLLFLVLVLSSCGSGEKVERDVSHSGEVAFDFLDSVVVESLSELYVSDKDEKTGRLLLNEKEMGEFYLTDLKGQIISRFSLKGEGPNQLLSPLEISFWKDGLVVSETSAGAKLHFFNGDLQKTGQSPVLAEDLNFLTIYNRSKNFSVVEKNGKILILGHDNNAMDSRLLSEQNGSLYAKAETGYIYVSGQEELFRLNLYPETWKPRMEQKWVGFSSPLIQVSKTDQVVAVLPDFGNQLFYYELNATGLTPLSEITLFHPERNEDINFDVKNDPGILYAYFYRLKGGGKYFLAEFRTHFPRDLYEIFRAKSEEFRSDPEFWEAVKKHQRPKYILTDTKGNQAAIAELPVSGEIHFLDADDVLYIKPNSETELDYNVFYRYRISLK